MLGDVVVYREFRGKIVMSNRPKKPEKLTPHQEKSKSRFLRAVQYAKEQISNAASKALYQPGPQSRFTSAYAVALADCLSAPVVELIDITHYEGAMGDEILFKAYDDFSVASVQLSIYSADGNLLEQGMPMLQENSVEDYVYTATTTNAVVAGTKISITVRDRPGNTTVGERVL